MPPFPSPTTKWHSKAYPSISPTLPSLSAKNKTVLITGGGTGIGAATAHHFAAAGASRIALLGRRKQPLLTTKASIEHQYPNTEIFIFPTDITNQDEVTTAFATFAADTKINILVSNAATIGPQGPIANVNGEQFISSIEQNLKGSLFTAQAFLAKAAKDAVVIETSSTAAHLDFGPGFAAYSVAKMGVVRLWDSVAFANPDLCVFHVQPGIVDTDMNREAGGIEAIGYEDDVSLPASFYVWLASSEARFLRGKFLWANWDVDELKARAGEIEGSKLLSVGLVGWPFGEDGWKATWKK
ncbi:hypothetical protein BDV23DRAFT_173361 [Aspergillus alliaceus]|uniref:Ketoreductase domain-containing protein n=1 Tax=Petromyces alliaceus TaxID=209559 RepID=A0A5N7C5Q5_PETAA|nr:hypothetical protein BDV23DRAFT_173361 [Aspergillus alliaceus]